MSENVSREEFGAFKGEVATKADLNVLAAATKADLNAMAADLNAMAAANKADLNAMAAANKADLNAMAAANKADLNAMAAANKADLNAMADTLRSEMKTSTNALTSEIMAISTYLGHIEEFLVENFKRLDGKFEAVDKRFDGISADLRSMRLNVSERLDLVGGQCRINDREHIRFENKLEDLEKRVYRLEQPKN